MVAGQACCDACDRKKGCAKFAYDKAGSGCTLFMAYAELYKVPGLIAGLLVQHSTDVAMKRGGDADLALLRAT